MSTTLELASPVREGGAAELVAAGVDEAREIEAPELREAHREAWLMRAAALAPERAGLLLEEIALDPDTRARARALMARAALESQRDEAEDAWQAALAALPGVSNDELQLELWNELCEAAMASAARRQPAAGDDRGQAVRLLRSLAPQIETLGGPEGNPASQALALALLGEALTALDEPLGLELLDRAEGLCRGLGVEEHVLAFAAQSRAARDLKSAAALTAEITDPTLRFETRLAVLGRTEEEGSELRGLVASMEEDLEGLEDFHSIHACARLASASQAVSPETAQRVIERARAQVDAQQPQLRALQLAGLGASVSAWDPEWADRIYREALEAARAETETVRRVVATIAVASQMGHGDPARAQPVLDGALQEAQSLDAMWELAHVLEVLLDPRGRPELNMSGAAPLLEAALARVSDEDLRLPGVFGLPEIARAYFRIDRERAAEVLTRWLNAARGSGDGDGMIGAAVGLAYAEPEAGQGALRDVAVRLAERLDPSGLSQLCAAAAEVAPELAAHVAAVIPESRERTRCLASAAAGTWPSSPRRAYKLVEQLPSADERSAALLTLCDQAFGTGDLPRPTAESELSVCCSLLPQLTADTAPRLRALLER